MQRRKYLCIGQPPIIRGNHQVPGIANESELKTFIPGRPEDFADLGRFGMLMVFGFPDRQRTLRVQDAQGTVNTASSTLGNMDENIF